MVYSSSASTRAYINAIALCALSLSAQSVSTVLADGTTVACTVSDGDQLFGVRAVVDTSCVNGGLGCYTDNCKYCKVIDTPKSTQFESCSSFGAGFPTIPQPVITTGPCEITQGDATVGIAATVDATCLYGGLGCFNDHCRFCKLKETPESTVFVDCSEYNATTIVTDATTTIPALTAVSNASSSDSVCSLEVSKGDAAVGINIVSDSSCTNGGVGCIDDVCRFCRVTTTVQSAPFIECTSIPGAFTTPSIPIVPPSDDPVETPTTIIPTVLPSDQPASDSTCKQVASDGDYKVGITIVTDPSCATGGIGCITDVCRFCRLVFTQQSAPFTDCGTIQGATVVAVSSTQDPTDSPTVNPLDSPTVNPLDTPTVNPVDTPTVNPLDSPIDPLIYPPANEPVCNQTVSSGDASVGINIATDTTCADGGVGCIDNVCRFCKVFDTAASTIFINCTDVPGYSTSATLTATTAPTDLPTDIPTDGSIETPATDSTSGDECTQVVSDGDAVDGIKIVTDTSCANGGVGCIDDLCRFCKVTSTEQSASFVDCP